MEMKQKRQPVQPTRRRAAPTVRGKANAAVKNRPARPDAPRPAPRRRPAPKPRPRRPDPEIVYTPPKPFNRTAFLLRLGIVAAVVLAVFLSLSLFFKVSENGVLVSGNQRYNVQTVEKASGIREGDSLLAVNKAKISSQIITKLPYVDSVRVGIKLPGTVIIEIEELDVVYAIAETGGAWWLMNSDGKLVEKTDAAEASAHTQVQGVYLDYPVAGQQAVAKEEEPEGTLPEGETQPVTISNAQRLQTALTILQYLEQNDVMGEVTSLDATDMGSIKMQYGDRFQIQLGDATNLDYKIEMAIAAVEKLEEHDRGTLDVSFIVRQDVIYTPRAD